MDGSTEASRNLERIQSVTDAALARLSTSELLNEMLDRVREILQVDTTAVLLLDPTGQRLTAVSARGLEEEVRQGVQIPVGQGFAGRIAAQLVPVTIERVDHQNVLNPILREKGVTSLLGVPLLVEGKAIGVLHVGTVVPRIFDDSDIELLQMVADRVALAIHARRTDDHLAAAHALQRSVLPAALPDINGLRMAARYAPGEGDVGGDWYDAFALPSGQVALAIGDVAGKGFDSAVVMARARSTLRAYTLISQDPAQILTHLDRNVLSFEPGQFLTIFLGILSSNSRSLSYSSAGHLMPVLALPSGSVDTLDGRVDPPVGVLWKRHSHSRDIPKGSTLYLFTDGLVERRDRPLDEGLAKLRKSATAGDPDRGCMSIVRATVGHAIIDDDLSLFAVHFIDQAD